LDGLRDRVDAETRRCVGSAPERSRYDIVLSRTTVARRRPVIEGNDWAGEAIREREASL